MREAIFKITQVVTNIARTISNVDRNNKKYSLGSSNENNGHFITLKMRQNVQGHCNSMTRPPLYRKKISQDSRETIQFGWEKKPTNPEEGCDRAVNQFCQSIGLVLDISQVAKRDNDTNSLISSEMEVPEPIMVKLTRRNAVKRKGFQAKRADYLSFYHIGPSRSNSDFLYLPSNVNEANDCVGCYSIDSYNFSDTMSTFDFQSNTMDTYSDEEGDREEEENEVDEYISLAELRKILFDTSRAK